MITTFYPPYNFGGDGIFVHRLANELAERGHVIDIIHCQDSYRMLARTEPEAGYHDHANITVHGLKSPAGPLSPLATQQTGHHLFKRPRFRQILEQAFDVIHYHNISLVGGPKILQYGRGVKLYTLHEYWLICPTHAHFKFNRAVCVQPQCLACCLIHKRPPQLWRYGNLRDAALRHVDSLIAPSRFSQELHRRMNINANIVHIPHFSSRFESQVNRDAVKATFNPAASTPYFLFVGRLEKLKGVQTLIPIFRRYPAAQLWIAGRGTYEAKLRDLAAGSDNIRFLGYQSPYQLRPLYQQAVAVLVPSIWEEVFGQVILESFQNGTPAIVRNLGGMPELIEESGGGFIYESEAELTPMISRLLREPGLRQRLGQSAYQAYCEKWTVEVHLTRYFELINQLSPKLAQHLPR